MVCKHRLGLFIILSVFRILMIRSSLTNVPTQALTALLSDDSKFGFIVIDGSGALFGTLQGNTREVLHKFTVDLPKKHGTELECLENTFYVVCFVFVYLLLFFFLIFALLFQAEEDSLLCVLLD